MRMAVCLVLVALMLVGWGPRAGEARAEVSFHFGYGVGFGHPYPYYRHRGFGYPYRYRHFHGYPRYRLGFFYSRPYYAPLYYTRRVYVQPPPAPAAPVAQPAYDTSYCREYTRPIIVGGEEQLAHGTACRQPDGTWRLMD